jgi:hypothetical protein
MSRNYSFEINSRLSTRKEKTGKKFITPPSKLGRDDHLP